MSYVALKDILIAARQESHRMRHFYLGIEHLFIALLEIHNGLASGLLTEHGLTPSYVIDAIRRKVGKGSQHRLWAGIPNTPRTELILNIAQEMAMEEGRDAVNERDLLLAILDENDSIATRVLNALGVSPDQARDAISNQPRTRTQTQQTFLKIEFASDFEGHLTKDELFVLRRMFHGYGRIVVEQQLTGGYTSARLLVVRPIQVDNRADAAVVVKIGNADAILDEAQRYERYVKGTLPPLTARLEDRPTAPETCDLAAIRYTLIADANGRTQNLRDVIQDWSGDHLLSWLRQQLYEGFGESWWKQSRPYRFEAWQEYDWLLPPVLTLELFAPEKMPTGVHVLRHPVKRDVIRKLQYGDLVLVENFIVQKVDRERGAIQLGLSQGSHITRAYKIEVRGIDFEQETYFRGEVVEKLIGRVWKTRNEQLINALRILEPDFNIDSRVVQLGDQALPNPIATYQTLLDATVVANLSTIHGDLHLGNILVGPQLSALLIDFGRTRDGHTIFDWVTLEMSLINERLRPLAAPGWEGARQCAQWIADLDSGQASANGNSVTADMLNVIAGIRQIASQHANSWHEYYLAAAFVSLRAMTWTTLSVDGRRLMFYLSALAIQRYQQRKLSDDSARTDIHASDATDFMSNDWKSN